MSCSNLKGKEREDLIVGQRSQIYIRYENEKHEKQLIARYYSWNFRERMISRARGIIEWLKDELKLGISSPVFRKKLERICDVNFNFHDVVLSQCIIDEFIESEEDMTGFNDYVFFLQGNNDGKLFIDILPDFSIRYAFTTYELSEYNPLNGDEYMLWESNFPEKWDIKEYFDRKTIVYTKKNIRYISRKAQLMTSDQLKEFVEADYSHLVSTQMLEKQNETIIENGNIHISLTEAEYELVAAYVRRQDRLSYAEDVLENCLSSSNSMLQNFENFIINTPAALEDFAEKLDSAISENNGEKEWYCVDKLKEIARLRNCRVISNKGMDFEQEDYVILSMEQMRLVAESKWNGELFTCDNNIISTEYVSEIYDMGEFID